jgi:hypothetical protein
VRTTHAQDSYGAAQKWPDGIWSIPALAVSLLLSEGVLPLWHALRVFILWGPGAIQHVFPASTSDSSEPRGWLPTGAGPSAWGRLSALLQPAPDHEEHT